MSKYNGWTNYETWCVALWIDNDEGLLGHYLDVAHSVSRYDLVAELKNAIAYDENPLNDKANLYTDLLSAALSNVNWYEIADHLIEKQEENE